VLEPLLALQQKQVAASEITTRDCELQGKADLIGCRLQSADLALFCCSDGNRRSFGDLAGLDRPQGLPPVRVDSGKGRLAFSNPQPTAFPSHAMNVSTVLLSACSHSCHCMQKTHASSCSLSQNSTRSTNLTGAPTTPLFLQRLTNS